jgi:hypothetical protein
VPIEELEAGLAGNHLYGLEDNLEAFGTFDEGGIIWSLERTNEFLLERGQISGGVPVSELIDSRLIRNADAGAK